MTAVISSWRWTNPQLIGDVGLAQRETLGDVAGRIPSVGRGGQLSTLDPRHLGEIELGWHAPSIVTAQKIANALAVPLRDLVTDLDSSPDRACTGAQPVVA